MVDAFQLLGFQNGGWGAALLMAASITVLLSVLGFALGAVFGGLAAAGRLHNSQLLRFLALGYCTVFRGVPDLLTIYLLYYGGSVALTSLGHSLGGSGFVGVPAFATGTLAIAIISGAYQAEVYRGAYVAIDQGQHDAACALGLNRLQRLRQIIFPQLLRYALPGLGNVWQLVLKDSSLISVIGLVELMRQAQIAAGSTREPFIFYIAAALLYLAIASVTGNAFYRLERKAPWRVRSA
ncbi:ABC transporter permease subunit [Mesorhizobium sp. M0904]